jgi:hypothetical protein
MRFLLAAVATGALASSAWAQVPQKLGYQGRLLKTDGTPAAGIVEITFAIFDAETAGKQLWTEKQMVGLTDGYYATFLGSASTPAGFPAGTFDGAERFLELTIAGETLKPRQRIASVAYALLATDAKNVVGGKVDAASVSVGGKTVINPSGGIVLPDGKTLTSAPPSSRLTYVAKTALTQSGNDFTLPSIIPTSATEVRLYALWITSNCSGTNLQTEVKFQTAVDTTVVEEYAYSGVYPTNGCTSGNYSHSFQFPVGVGRRVNVGVTGGAAQSLSIYVLGYR